MVVSDLSKMANFVWFCHAGVRTEEAQAGERAGERKGPEKANINSIGEG